MKRILLLLAALTIAATASAQYKPNNEPFNILAPKDTTIKIDNAAYQAHDDFSYYLNSAGKNIITSVVLDGIGVASALIGTQQKNQEKATIFYVVGVGSVVVGVIFLLNAGLDLKSASESHRKIHPIPNGVSIDLN